MDPILVGALTALLGALSGAAAAHWLEKSARDEERRQLLLSREGQISPDAYSLRRQLIAWLREARVAESIELAEGWAKEVSRHFDAAEARMNRLAAAAADISSERAAATRRAFVLFYEATGLLNAAAAGEVVVWQSSQEPRTSYARPGAIDFVSEAQDVLRQCVAELEKVIDAGILTAEQSIESTYERNKEDT